MALNSFEENKRELLDKLRKQNTVRKPLKPAVMSKPVTRSATSNTQEVTKNVAIFSTSTLFSKSLIATIQGFAKGTQYTSPEKLLDSYETIKFEFIILDMDPPTDWKASHDVFSSISIIAPEAKCIMFSSNKDLAAAKVLEKKGALYLLKPVKSYQIKDIIKGQ